jgi:hypothetical protein
LVSPVAASLVLPPAKIHTARFADVVKDNGTAPREAAITRRRPARQMACGWIEIQMVSEFFQPQVGRL